MRLFSPQIAKHLMLILSVLLFIYVLLTAPSFERDARWFPTGAAAVGILLCVLDFGLQSRHSARRDSTWSSEPPDPVAARDVPEAIVRSEAAKTFAWFLGLVASVIVLGFHVSVPLFLILYLRLRGKTRLWVALAFAAGTYLIIFILLDSFANFRWLEPVALGWLGIFS